MPDNIILCGFMGTGKTTVGRLITARQHWRFVDTDRIIEQRQGKSISAIFADEGESAFRRLESALCRELRGWQHMVIATGGGIVLDPANRENLVEAGLVVCLEAPPEEIAARLVHVTDRPLLAGPDPISRIKELLAARASAYGALPYHIDTAERPAQAVADEIVALWLRLKAGVPGG